MADLSLDKEALQSVIRKNGWSSQLKAAIEQVREEYAFSLRWTRRLMTMAASSYRYQTTRSDEPLRTRLVELAREKPRFRYRRPHVLLRRSGQTTLRRLRRPQSETQDRKGSYDRVREGWGRSPRRTAQLRQSGQEGV